MCRSSDWVYKAHSPESHRRAKQVMFELEQVIMQECEFQIRVGLEDPVYGGIVLRRYFQRLVRPWVKAEYAACGWEVATSARRLISSVYIFLLQMYSVNVLEPMAAPRCCFPMMVMFTLVPAKSS